ncbi:homeodomain-like protein [Tanacetum coccineum]
MKDLDAYSIGTTLFDDALPPKEKDPGSIAEDVLVEIDKFVFPVDFIVLDMPEDIKTPLILGRPFLSIAHAKIDVFKRKITLRIGNDKVVSLDLLYGDYIELNDLNEPLELRRNRVDDLEPIFEDGEVVDEPIMDIVKTRCDDKIIDGLDEYHSYCDFDRKIHIGCAYNLQFSCMIGYEHVNANFFPLLSIRFYNSIRKYKVEFKGKNIVRTFMNVPIFVGNFSVLIDFAVVENMDSYRDEGMGDVIVGRPFCREAYVKARWLNGMINIQKGNDCVTYQMARSHPRFKHLTNAQCNKMRPLLKVSAHNELKGVVDALADYEANKSSWNGHDSHNSGSGSGRTSHTARVCTYNDFLNCQPLNFKDTKGVVGLTQWFEKMEFVFYI